MSQPINDTATIDVTDPRVAEISDLSGMTPDEVVATAERLSADYGDTVSEELDEGVAEFEAQDALSDLLDADDLDLDVDDEADNDL